MVLFLILVSEEHLTFTRRRGIQENQQDVHWGVPVGWGVWGWVCGCVCVCVCVGGCGGWVCVCGVGVCVCM